jgi:hypothetical protein
MKDRASKFRFSQKLHIRFSWNLFPRCISYSTTNTTIIKAYTEYNNSWWLVVVISIEPLPKELNVILLHPYGPRISFKFPKIPINLNVELGIIADLLLQTPTLGSRQNYYIVLQQVDDIERVFSQSYFSFFLCLTFSW